MIPQAEAELLQLTQKLLDAIAAGDWETYKGLCDPSLTAFEPEAPGQLVQGLNFHRFFFDLGGVRGRHQTTICSPHVRLLGDMAIVSYARLVQKVGDDGEAVTVLTMETRVWRREGDGWKHIHFHRSTL
jgi:calcium/calmodulin-dependent protein kinase (CaM kinase) II